MGILLMEIPEPARNMAQYDRGKRITIGRNKMRHAQGRLPLLRLAKKRLHDEISTTSEPKLMMKNMPGVPFAENDPTGCEFGFDRSSRQGTPPTSPIEELRA